MRQIASAIVCILFILSPFSLRYKYSLFSFRIEHCFFIFCAAIKLIKLNPQMVVADAGYKTPAIAHRLLKDGIQPLFPYTRPKTKEGFFGKHEFAYDEYYDCYICPGAHILAYSTTNRSGYKEYKSCGEHCAECQCLSKCTESKDHVKLITRHVWEEYMEVVEDIRHTIGNRQIYQLRKETIERIFGTAKEQHGFRYTQYVGKARMEMKAGLYLCMHEFEKTGKDPGKTRLEHSQIFVDFEENKKKRSFKRKMVLGIIPNTKFVYSLTSGMSNHPRSFFIQNNSSQ